MSSPPLRIVGRAPHREGPDGRRSSPASSRCSSRRSSALRRPGPQAARGQAAQVDAVEVGRPVGSRSGRPRGGHRLGPGAIRSQRTPATKACRFRASPQASSRGKQRCCGDPSKQRSAVAGPGVGGFFFVAGPVSGSLPGGRRAASSSKLFQQPRARCSSSSTASPAASASRTLAPWAVAGRDVSIRAASLCRSLASNGSCSDPAQGSRARPRSWRAPGSDRPLPPGAGAKPGRASSSPGARRRQVP